MNKEEALHQVFYDMLFDMDIEAPCYTETLLELNKLLVGSFSTIELACYQAGKTLKTLIVNEQRAERERQLKKALLEKFEAAHRAFVFGAGQHFPAAMQELRKEIAEGFE